ncbi:unnamed protein product [Periconia digitata]|uniref:Uncharacterized protein n=1 Tax=Periconia digitata TaxID=1303443 RepID=A0A9W4U2R7_9PLEO|nr:unnamed protein product [Periconia digitata]
MRSVVLYPPLSQIRVVLQWLVPCRNGKIGGSDVLDVEALNLVESLVDNFVIVVVSPDQRAQNDCKHGDMPGDSAMMCAYVVFIPVYRVTSNTGQSSRLHMYVELTTSVWRLRSKS